jgi:hypothetical protein
LAERLLPHLTLDCCTIDGSAGDWPSREAQILHFLGLPPIRDIDTPVEQPSRYVGRYRDTASVDELVVAAGRHGLFLDDARRTPLIARPDGRFRVAAMDVEVTFSDPRDGRFQLLQLRGNLPGLSPDWRRAEEALAGPPTTGVISKKEGQGAALDPLGPEAPDSHSLRSGFQGPCGPWWVQRKALVGFGAKPQQGWLSNILTSLALPAAARGTAP